MLPEIKNKIKNNNSSENNRYLIANKSSPNKTKNKYNLKKYNVKKELPPINQNIDMATKIKKSSLKKSISYLYKSLFPDEKNSMEDFLNNFSYDKFLKRPHWKYTFYSFKDTDRIKKDLMMKNKPMKYYNKMKKPCFIKKEFKKKPRMVQIIEDNCSYKNRLYDSPSDYFLFSNIKNKSKIDINKDEDENDENYEGEENNLNIFKNNMDINKTRNKVHFSNIYRGDIYPFMKNKILLSPLKYIKIKDGENKNTNKSDSMKSRNLFQNEVEYIEEE